LKKVSPCLGEVNKSLCPPTKLAVLEARAFTSLRRHRNYRLYFSGQLVSLIGNSLQTAALAIVAFARISGVTALYLIACTRGP
jgi:hypothetical protein